MKRNLLLFTKLLFKNKIYHNQRWAPNSEALFLFYGFFCCTELEVPEIKNDLVIRFHRLVSLSDLI